MPKAQTPSEGGAQEMSTYQWAYTGQRSTPEEAGYEPQKEPLAQTDNDWNKSVQTDIWRNNYAAGQNEQAISDLEGRVDSIESDLSSIEGGFAGHTHDSRYYTKTEVDDMFLTPSEADSRYYTRSEADSEFLTQPEAEGLFYTEAESEDRFVNESGDTMSGNLTIDPAGTTGDVDGQVTLRSYDAGESLVQFEHGGTNYWTISTGDYFADEDGSGYDIAFRDQQTGINPLEIEQGGGVTLSGSAGAALDASGLDYIGIPQMTTDPNVPSGIIGIWARPDQTV